MSKIYVELRIVWYG